MTNREIAVRKFNLGSVVIGCLVAFALLYLQGYTEDHEQKEIESARELAAKARAVEWSDLDKAGRHMTAFDKIKK
jgi:hypothetical protein